MSFKARLGFLEQETDVKNMIAGIEFAQSYQTIIGQMPELHPWLFDNQKLMALVKWLSPSIPDPLNDIRVVSPKTESSQGSLTNLSCRLPRRRSNGTESMETSQQKGTAVIFWPGF
jgi:hypothetical protein